MNHYVDVFIILFILGDVLARGCDFQNIDKVIQYDFATNIVTYLHRVGRTARMNSTGNGT